MAFALTYEQWVKQATSSESIPPNSDGLLHVGERAALVEQLSYLKKRNAQLMKQQRAVLLAACEAQAAHAQCADFAGELMRAKMTAEAQQERRPVEEGYEDVADKLQRLEHENAELLRKTAVLVDYVRATAPLPRAAYGRDDDDDDDEDDDDDYEEDDKELPPKIGTRVGGSCLGPPVGFDEFANRHWRQCKWDSFVAGVVGAFGPAHAGAVEDE